MAILVIRKMYRNNISLILSMTNLSPRKLQREYKEYNNTKQSKDDTYLTKMEIEYASSQVPTKIE
ncbi:hypothetical protein AGMMS50267_07890 [Spirochaetia bacterium]|nr:hypothetical protein AGMMS50267_07890 [Spirochaetia bacterium]